MAQVKNESAGAVDVPLYGLRFAAGETVEVDDAVANTLGAPLVVVPQAPAAPQAPTAVPPVAPASDQVAAAQAELQKAQADLAAAEATQHQPVVPAGGNVQ